MCLLCWYLVVYEHVVEIQTRCGGLVRAAGPTQSSWSWVRQQAKAGSLVIQSLTLTLQDQVQQGLWLLLLAAPTLQQQHRESLCQNRNLNLNPLVL